MKIFFSLLFTTFFYQAQACEVHFPERIILSGVVGEYWPFIHKDCSIDKLSALSSMLQSHEGMISIERLQAAVGENTKIISKSNQIRIQTLQNLIHKNFPASADSEMIVSDGSTGDIIGLDLSAEVKVKCHPCSFQGSEVIRLETRSYGSLKKDYSFNAKFDHFVKAARAKSLINAFSNKLNADQFEIVKVPQVAFGRYQTNLNKIGYFKTNKTIRAGEFLRESDLVPLTLVRAGDKVDLYIENEQVSVKSHATSRQSGGLGEKVEVWNQANGKKYRGVITDHNKVVVEI